MASIFKQVGNKLVRWVAQQGYKYVRVWDGCVTGWARCVVVVVVVWGRRCERFVKIQWLSAHKLEPGEISRCVAFVREWGGGCVDS